MKKIERNYNLKSIGDLFELRKLCISKLRKSVEYLDMPCVFYYIRMIEFLNILIRKKGY